MVEFIGKLTKAGDTNKIHVSKELLENGTLVTHRTLSVEVRLPEAPFTLLVPTMQTKVVRFGKEFGLSVPSAFVTGGVLKRHQFYKVRVVS
jgi:hypothetical protein